MKKVKISLILNLLIFIFVTVCTIFMFTGIKFMPGESLLELSKIEMFKFYTVDSNILIGIVSLILAIYEIRLLKGSIKKIPKKVYILKFIGTSAISLTFFVTLLFLTPKYGFYAMYSNNNLFFHMIVPLLSFISYIFFEKHDNKLRYSFLGIIPMALYSIYYISMIVINRHNGGLTIKYDFYGFLGGKLSNAFITIPVIYLISYIFAVMFIVLNIKINKKKN